jgi:hypothetical protein
MTTQIKRRAWSRKELKLLKDMYAAGVSIYELEKVFNRTRSAIYKKCFNEKYVRGTAVRTPPPLPAPITETETVFKGEVTQNKAPSWFTKLLGNMIGVHWSKETKTTNKGSLLK